MKEVVVFIFVVFSSLGVFSQNILYSIQSLPNELRNSSAMVVRYHSRHLEIEKEGKATMEEKRVITLLNKSAAVDAVFMEYEDAFRKLSKASITVYDMLGKEIKSYKKKQLEKNLYDDGVSFVTNTKTYYFDVPIPSYPITIEFETTVQMSGFLDFEDFYAQYTEDAIQLSEYSITAPTDNAIRYKNYHTDIKPTITTNGDKTTYKWQVSNVKPLGVERNSFRSDGIPRVYITPTKFKMDDYVGSFESWNEYGKWYYELCKNAYDFTPAQQNEILNVVMGISEPRTIIERLYKYMQQNCRYVGIQLGIGGFRPLSNSFVHRTKYGDCKALTTYMQAMLSLVNIKSHQALINGGSKLLPVDPMFPNHQFNHVILCVPNNNDTIWLECTSQDNAVGELGAFTENKLALLCTESGGVLVSTPKSSASNNSFTSSSTVAVDADFVGEAILKFYSKGEYNRYLNAYLVNETLEEQKNYLIKNLQLKPTSFIINDGVPSANTAAYKVLYEKIHDFKAGSKYFLRRHLYALNTTTLPRDSVRLNDYNLEFPYFKSDTTTYIFPNSIEVESSMTEQVLNCKAASFKSEIKLDNEAKSITIISYIHLKQHKIPAADYAETKKFFDDVNEMLNKKIVVKPKT